MTKKKSSKGEYSQAIVALMSVIIGSGLTALFGHFIWQEQKKTEYGEMVLMKRLELIDRTAKVFERSKGIDDIWETYMTTMSVSSGAKITVNTDLSEKLGDYGADFLSTVLLDSLFFGSGTRMSVHALNSEKGPWWKRSDEKKSAILENMIKELNVGLPIK